MEVIVIGGSAAGLKAACRIARLQSDANIKVIVKEKPFGYSSCGLAYYLAGDVDSAAELYQTANGTTKDEKYYRDVKGIEILSLHEALSIDRVRRLVTCRDLKNDSDKILPYDKLIIATGALPLLPAIPGVDSPGVVYFHSVEDAVALRKELEQGKIGKVAIIGGGYIGMELCEAFASMWGVEVQLIEMQSQVLPIMVDPELSKLIESELVKNGIDLLIGCRCREIVNDKGNLGLFDGSGNFMPVDKVIVATGMKPNTILARKAGLEIGVTGGIKVDDGMHTSDLDVFAVGDCVELNNAIDGKPSVYNYGSLANRMGRVAGDNVCNGNASFGSVVGAAILKVFDLTVASVGLSSTQCDENGYDINGCWATFYDRLHYYPEAGYINAKMNYDKSNGLILGLQFVANGNLQHVIDKASLILQAGWNIDRLSEIEHVYSPPYSLPFDPLTTMGYIANNCSGSGIKMFSPSSINSLPEKAVVVDVRTVAEIKAENFDIHHDNVVEIPIEDLRGRLNELPKNVQIITLCQMGSRSWDAALMIRRAGWQDVGFIGGGTQFQPEHLVSVQKFNGKKE